jgi:hypothetical protein
MSVSLCDSWRPGIVIVDKGSTCFWIPAFGANLVVVVNEHDFGNSRANYPQVSLLTQK